jgi:Cu(I)/Ag(I) efflux system membrane protein CusA/SilA
MVEKLISFSLRNRMVVLIVSACLFGWGIYSVQQTLLMLFLTCPKIKLLFLRNGWRSPRDRDQVRHPLVSNLQGVPKLEYSLSRPCLG